MNLTAIAPAAATVIAALISAGVTLIISITTQKSQISRVISELDRNEKQLAYRIDRLEQILMTRKR